MAGQPRRVHFDDETEKQRRARLDSAAGGRRRQRNAPFSLAAAAAGLPPASSLARAPIVRAAGYRSASARSATVSQIIGGAVAVPLIRGPRFCATGREPTGPEVSEASSLAKLTASTFPAWIVAESRSIPESVDYGKLRTNREGLYSTLMPWMAEAVADIVRPLVATGRILDATANIGGDALNFAHNFPGAQVTAIEANPANLTILRRNVEALGLRDRVDVVGGNCFTFIESRDVSTYDFVYCDPPWGGPGAGMGKPKTLRLCAPAAATSGASAASRRRKDISVHVFVAQVFGLGISRVVVLKTPPNFDEDKFRRKLAGHVKSTLVRETIWKRNEHPPTVSFYLYVIRLEDPPAEALAKAPADVAALDDYVTELLADDYAPADSPADPPASSPAGSPADSSAD